MKASRIAPWVAAALALGGALVPVLRPARGGDLGLDAFAQLPVLEGGRVKPIDSVARNALLLIRGQQAFRHEGRGVEPDEWLLDVMFRPELADAQPVFVVDDPEVLGLMGLAEGDRHLAMKALAPHLEEIQRQAAAARRPDAKERSRFQRAIVNLHDRMFLYYRLRNTMQPARSAGLASELAALGRPGERERFAALAALAVFRAVPARPGRDWRNAGEALIARLGGDRDPSLAELGPARRGLPGPGPPPSERRSRSCGRCCGVVA